MVDDAEEKRIERNLITRSGESEAEVRSMFRTIEANYTDRHEASRGLSATAELLLCFRRPVRR